jgi:hypothetical protein
MQRCNECVRRCRDNARRMLRKLPNERKLALLEESNERIRCQVVCVIDDHFFGFVCRNRSHIVAMQGSDGSKKRDNRRVKKTEATCMMVERRDER